MFGELLRSFNRKSPSPAFEAASVSSPGGRKDNEDACGFRMIGDTGCWILCDGLGGHRGGEIAARTAVDAALASFESDPGATPEALAGHVSRANQAVLERQLREPELSLMRTTIVALLADRAAAMWSHAGDSRLYRIRNGRILDQTRDDSVPQRLVDAGEISAAEIRFHEDRSRLLRTLGNRGEAGATFGSGEVEPGDTFLLASDGFWELIVESEIEADLARSGDPKTWLARMEARIRERIAKEAERIGEADNYSAIAVVRGK
jgi:serine/threonine protein phosphatase PrpC